MLVINKKTKYGYINLSNTVIIASDMTLRGYKYRQIKSTKSKQKTKLGIFHYAEAFELTTFLYTTRTTVQVFYPSDGELSITHLYTHLIYGKSFTRYHCIRHDITRLQIQTNKKY
jgi:hypothetical protein